MKICAFCKHEKSFDNFHRYSRSKDGYKPVCKSCNCEAAKKWRESNPEKKKQFDSDYAIKNKEKLKSYKAKWYLENIEKMKVKAKLYHEMHREKIVRKAAEWCRNNPDKRLAQIAKRRATKIKSTPSWIDKSAVQDFYIAAKMFQMYTGVEYHVDHIVPLRSKIVCGLHVQDNLQILPYVDNVRKSNLYWENMP